MTKPSRSKKRSAKTAKKTIVRLLNRVRGKANKAKKALLPTDPLESAKHANLRYVDDSGSGIRRVKQGKGFRYERDDHKPVKDATTLKRIASLVIPPAWSDVWICPSHDGHIQVTGRDARGRKQYRYHTKFREIRDATKYERMLAFAEALPTIRKKVDGDLSLPGLPREKVLASIVRLLEITLIRVGNEEYAKTNASFGLTTMRERHVDVTGSNIAFHFRGKSGVAHKIEVHDPRVAKIVAKCEDLPGQLLFQYLDDKEKLCSIESSDVNAYLREASEFEFTAKDFRTWAGTVLCATALHKLGIDVVEELTVAAKKKNVVSAIKDVAQRLGNTATVCKKCYVHPEIVGAYLDGQLSLEHAPKSLRGSLASTEVVLSTNELAVLALLRARIAARARELNKETKAA